MNRPVVFLGPSLTLNEASSRLPTAEFRPPARRDDLDKIDGTKTRVVVLIDGTMVYDHPPSPSEVWRLVDRGITVFGAASLGALRAVELRDLGVRGVGWVYRQYLNGLVTADDELLARLDPRTQSATTVFQINIRFGLGRLRRRGVISHFLAESLLQDIAGLYFEDRSPTNIERIGRAHGLSSSHLAELFSRQSDIKARDAAVALATARFACAALGTSR